MPEAVGSQPRWHFKVPWSISAVLYSWMRTGQHNGVRLERRLALCVKFLAGEDVDNLLARPLRHRPSAPEKLSSAEWQAALRVTTCSMSPAPLSLRGRPRQLAV